jgi:TusA-related sulfurtransferase
MEESRLLTLDLSSLSEEVVQILLDDPGAEPSLFDEIAKANTNRPEILKCLLHHPATPEETRNFVSQTLQVPVPVKVEVAETETSFYEQRTQTLLQRIQKLKIGERIQLALKGSREIRSILLRDSSKEVAMTVLDNPKITENEIEIIAKQRTTPDDIIRKITKKREWLKNYAIMHALVRNPKTPLATALKLVYNIKIKDLELIEKDKNISGAIRAAAKKIVKIKKTT